MKKRVVLCGASAISRIQNFGDQLLRDLCANWVREVLPDADVAFAQTSNRFGWLDRDTIRPADALIFVGGGYFQEKTRFHSNAALNWVHRMAWSWRNANVYGGAWRAAKEQGAAVAMVGLEAGPVRSRAYQELVREIALEARVCVVRNVESRNYLCRLGVPADSVAVCLDAAASLGSIVSPVVDAGKVVARPGALRIGLHVHKVHGDGWRRAMTGGLVQIRQQTKGDIAWSYLHDQKIAGVHPKRSVVAANWFARELAGMSEVGYESPQQLIKELSALDMVITSKLHVGIVSRGLGKEVLCVLDPAHLKEPRNVNKQCRFYGAIGESWRCDSVQKLQDDFSFARAAERAVQVGLGAPASMSREAQVSAEENRRRVQEFVRSLE